MTVIFFIQGNTTSIADITVAMNAKLDGNVTVAPATLIEFASALYQATTPTETEEDEAGEAVVITIIFYHLGEDMEMKDSES